jgi:hypothetical protein
MIGHSAGAAAILDALDPPSNPAACLPPSFALLAPIETVTALGCTLQPRALHMALPHRSEDQPLDCPLSIRLLFVAGEQDLLATPDLVRQTAVRYRRPASSFVLPNATHYGWAGPREQGDDPRFDGDTALDTSSQRRATLALIQTFVGHASANDRSAVSAARQVNFCGGDR